jgi:hypothetical protein
MYAEPGASAAAAAAEAGSSWFADQATFGPQPTATATDRDKTVLTFMTIDGTTDNDAPQEHQPHNPSYKLQSLQGQHHLAPCTVSPMQLHTAHSLLCPLPSASPLLLHVLFLHNLFSKKLTTTLT